MNKFLVLLITAVSFLPTARRADAARGAIYVFNSA